MKCWGEGRCRLTLIAAWLGVGAALTIALVVILAVKINLLLLFKRPGTQITTYMIFRYVVLFITIVYGATNLGLMDYKCLFGNFEYILMSCTQRPALKRYLNFQIVSVVLDVFPDLFSQCCTSLSSTVLYLRPSRLDYRGHRRGRQYLWRHLQEIQRNQLFAKTGFFIFFSIPCTFAYISSPYHA